MNFHQDANYQQISVEKTNVVSSFTKPAVLDIPTKNGSSPKESSVVDVRRLSDIDDGERLQLDHEEDSSLCEVNLTSESQKLVLQTNSLDLVVQ